MPTIAVIVLIILPVLNFLMLLMWYLFLRRKLRSLAKTHTQIAGTARALRSMLEMVYFRQSAQPLSETFLQNTSETFITPRPKPEVSYRGRKVVFFSGMSTPPVIPDNQDLTTGPSGTPSPEK